MVLGQAVSRRWFATVGAMDRTLRGVDIRVVLPASRLLRANKLPASPARRARATPRRATPWLRARPRLRTTARWLPPRAGRLRAWARRGGPTATRRRPSSARCSPPTPRRCAERRAGWDGVEDSQMQSALGRDGLAWAGLDWVGLLRLADRCINNGRRMLNEGKGLDRVRVPPNDQGACCPYLTTARRKYRTSRAACCLLPASRASG